jgi:L-tartrate/succinate antiporter
MKAIASSGHEPTLPGVTFFRSIPWRAILPLAAATVIAISPAPPGLAQHAWYFFAIFAGVILGLVLEPLPGGAVGLIGFTAGVTSSMFLTGVAPNLRAMELSKKTVALDVGWMDWFLAFAPAGIALLVATPLLAYWLYPPEVKESAKIQQWAASGLGAMGKVTTREKLLSALVVTALALWIFGADFINATPVALLVIALMLLTRVVAWDDMLKHSAAWNTLAWFAMLVTLADGLNRVGFVKWFAESIGQQVSGVSPIVAMLVLTVVFFIVHYRFASITAQVTAVR